MCLFRASLENERLNFMLYLRGEVFIRAALVKVGTFLWPWPARRCHPWLFDIKVKGTVVGYLTPEVGIIEVQDSDGQHKKVEDLIFFLFRKVNEGWLIIIQVAFHINDVWVYKKPLLQYNSESTSSLLPVGETGFLWVTGCDRNQWGFLNVIKWPWVS